MENNLFEVKPKLSNSNIIKSISYSQDEIITSIITLHCPDGFELDPTYSKGNFYKNIPKPKYCYDLDPPKGSIAKQSDSRELPHEDNSIKSIMFDPPFLSGVPSKKGKHKEKNNKMFKRFTAFHKLKDLWVYYKDSLVEFYRILEPGGVLVFKCQDTVDHNLQHFSHVEVINLMVAKGFYPKDMFLLLATNRIIGLRGGKSTKQEHARKYHSYFIVATKQVCKVKYSFLPNPANELYSDNSKTKKQ